MAKSRQEKEIIAVLEAEAALQGFDLVDVELAGVARKPVIRVWLDREHLNLDDVAAANSWIATRLEELDPVRGSYTLEVSSPGIDRPLRTIKHFERFVGEDVVVVTVPINGRGKWTGRLCKIIRDTNATYDGSAASANNNDSKIVLELDSKTLVEIPFEQIKKANLRGKVDFQRRED